MIPAAAELQNIMLAPLRKEDRYAHFLKCMLAIAKACAGGHSLTRVGRLKRCAFSRIMLYRA